MTTIISFDLDDTLIRTGELYDSAYEHFGVFMEDSFGINKQHAVTTARDTSFSMMDEYGLSIDRVSISMIQAAEQLVDDISEDSIDRIREIGYEPFISEEEFAERGFIDGAERMLDNAAEIADKTIIVTVGDPRGQQPKINALGLDTRVDEVYIPSYDTGKAMILDSVMKDNGVLPNQVFHIGNSATSDMRAITEVGGWGIYIPCMRDIFADDEQHDAMINHERVFTYETANEVADALDTLVERNIP